MGGVSGFNTVEGGVRLRKGNHGHRVMASTQCPRGA
jgi:hypothetical protein